MRFVNRRHELEHLEKEFRDNQAKLIVIYGRRRIGKTRLIEEFLQGRENSGYYLAAQESDFQQIAEFKEILGHLLHDDFLLQNQFAGWKSLFTYLEKVWPKEKKTILAIDEVTYIIKSNPSFTSYLQKFWDTFLSKTKTMLILSGSLVGLMVEEVLGEKSPLYGRRTSQLKIDPLGFKEAGAFLEGKSFKEKIEIYAITGGVPKYLMLVAPKEGLAEFILNHCFSKEGFFYQEGLFLISQEFREPSTYLNILKAIAFGNSKMNDIANFTGIESKKISSYLDILLALGFIKKEVPLTEKRRDYRGAVYKLEDSFLSFWHRFVYPGRSKIEIHEEKSLYAEKKGEIQQFIGKKFEELCLQFVRQHFSYPETGTWWGHYRDEKNIRQELEVDICALDHERRSMLLGECKWSEKVDAFALLRDLKRKAQHIDWNKEKRDVKYALFARSFSNAEMAKEKGVYLFDLDTLEKKW